MKRLAPFRPLLVAASRRAGPRSTATSASSLPPTTRKSVELALINGGASYRSLPPRHPDAQTDLYIETRRGVVRLTVRSEAAPPPAPPRPSRTRGDAPRPGRAGGAARGRNGSRAETPAEGSSSSLPHASRRRHGAPAAADDAHGVQPFAFPPPMDGLAPASRRGARHCSDEVEGPAFEGEAAAVRCRSHAQLQRLSERSTAPLRRRSSTPKRTLSLTASSVVATLASVPIGSTRSPRPPTC